jgi:hypothetical protein
MDANIDEPFLSVCNVYFTALLAFTMLAAFWIPAQETLVSIICS